MENVMPLEIVRNGFIPPLINQVSKKEKELENVCSEMIRKDLELMVLEHKLQTIFDSCQFYSVTGDDFSSIEHSIIMASKNGLKSVDERISDNIKEGVTHLIFDLFERKNPSLYEINVVAKKISKLIFKVTKYDRAELAFVDIELEFAKIHEFLDR